MFIRFEMALCVIAVMTGFWFLLGVYRMKNLCESGEAYLAQFDDMCGDDNISMDILERFQNVFGTAHGYRAAILLIQIFVKRDDTRLAQAVPDIGRLPLDSSMRLGKAAFLLMMHISYYAPILGFVLRNVFMGRQASSASSDGGALLIAASERLSHAS